MGEMTLTEVERIGAFGEAERTFLMTEEAFRIFYEQTARSVWLYLARTTGDDRLADDLLQETYYRFLRTRATFESDDHRRHYLFRIATNLIHDHRRRPRRADAPVDAVDAGHAHTDGRAAERAVSRLDLTRAMGRMKPRDRALLLLAYVQGFSHEEIAELLGLRKASLKALLYRARQRLLGLLCQPNDRGGRR